MNYQTFKWEPDFKLEVQPPRGFALSDYDKMHVEMLWRDEAIARSSQIFNGHLLNFVSFQGSRMVGEFVDYKFYLAQIRDPGLKPLLQITPIAINGLTLAGDKLLIGRRSDIMRYFVDESPRENVSLATEIKFLENYIALEEIRIRHGVTVNFDRQYEGEPQIPPMLLMTIFVLAAGNG